MNRKYSTINYDKLWSPSGDVFADAGGYALKYLSEKFPEKDILELIEYATEIYVDKWVKSIYQFFPNCPILQNKGNSIKQKEDTIKYFVSLLNNQNAVNVDYCRILGFKTELFLARRNNSILTGAGSFANCHHYFEDGLPVSKEVIIRFYFLPFGSEMLCGKLCVIHSNNPLTSEFYVRECCDLNIRQLGQNITDSISNNYSQNVSTAIFRFLDAVFLNVQNEKFEYITLYNYTNYNQGPDLQVYYLPFEAFDFYRETQRSIYKDSWNKFVARYYGGENNPYDEASNTISYKKKNVGESEFKYWKNTIYERLINQQSILPQILEWSVDNLFDIYLLKCYLYNILKMKKESIDKIMMLADFVVDNTKEVDMKKVLSKLNGIKSSFLLRKFLLKIVERNFSDGNSDPIITVQDYTEYLFPEDNFWKEIRDVLLIAIYQRLHERNVKVENMEIDDDFADDDE